MHEPARRRRTMRAAARVGLGASGAARATRAGGTAFAPALPGRFARGDDVGGFPAPGAATSGPVHDGLDPRQRIGLAENPEAQPRLWSSEPGAQDRLELEAGRVERSWSHGGGERAVVPAPALMTDPVPVPRHASAAPLPAGTLSPSGLARLRARPSRG